MYTRCSHCDTVCEVSPEALAQGRGRLPCAHCGQAFDALEHLTGDAPADYAPPPASSTQYTFDLASPEPSHHRTDALVDVLTAHADFIEPMDVDTDIEVAVDDLLVPAAASANSQPPDPVPQIDPALAHVPTLDQERDDTAAIAQDFHQETFHTSYPAPPESSDDHGADDPPAGLPEDMADVRRDDEESLTTQEQLLGSEAPALSDTPDADAAGNTSSVPHPTLSAPTPSFIPDTVTAIPVEAPPQRQWPRWLAVAALLLLLCGQSLYAERDHLAADATWRPWLERACSGLGCSLPAWHDPAAMRLMTRDVRPHPSVSDALLISASFRNDAAWSQQWPRLHLSLSDLNGQTIAQREFAPDQYLGMTARDLTIQPGQTASVTLEVRDPGKQAVAFEFDFR